MSSIGQRDDLFPDLLGRISGPQSLISFCSPVSAAWNDNETHLNPSFFFLSVPYMNNASDICLWVVCKKH